jgi:hypothetical protein
VTGDQELINFRHVEQIGMVSHQIYGRLKNERGVIICLIPMKIRKQVLLLIIAAVGLCALPFQAQLRHAFLSIRGKKSIADRVAEYGAAARARLQPDFERIGLVYPPQRLLLLGLKDERRLEIWVQGTAAQWKFLKDYPILGMSGGLGPKLRQGDRQVPEGIYRVEALNPNSLYHLSLRLDYPNQADRQRGREDGRTNLGSDIMIHGKTCSIGCLAMGDPAAEELFILAAETADTNITVVLSPIDFRKRELPGGQPPVPAWTAALYDSIKRQLEGLEKNL